MHGAVWEDPRTLVAAGDGMQGCRDAGMQSWTPFLQAQTRDQKQSRLSTQEKGERQTCATPNPPGVFHCPSFVLDDESSPIRYVTRSPKSVGQSQRRLGMDCVCTLVKTRRAGVGKHLIHLLGTNIHVIDLALSVASQPTPQPRPETSTKPGWQGTYFPLPVSTQQIRPDSAGHAMPCNHCAVRTRP